MRIKRLILLFVSIFSLIFLSGCWDLVEITERGSVNSIFLDKSRDQKVIIGASLNVPGSLMPPYVGTVQQFAKRNYLIVGTGRGIVDALKDLQTILAREVFFGQLRVIVITEQFAKDNIRNMLNYFGRLPQIPGTVKLLLTHDDPAELLDQKLNNNMPPGNYITEFLNTSSKQTTANPLELWQVFTNLADGTADVYMPVIKSTQGQYKIAGVAFFSKYRYVGELSEEETQVLSILREYNNGYLTVPFASNSLISYTNVQSKTKIIPKRDLKGDLSFEITCNVTGSLRETIPETPELTPRMEKEFINRTQTYLTQSLTKLVDKLQQFNSDPIGLGKKVKAEFSDYWRKIDWHEVYPISKIKVKVKFSNRNTGTLR